MTLPLFGYFENKGIDKKQRKAIRQSAHIRGHQGRCANTGSVIRSKLVC